MSRRIFCLLLTLISLLYLFIRLHDLYQTLDFRLDQGFFLIDSKSTIESPTIRLLGPPTSKIHEGRSFFVGSYYYYFLGNVGYIFHWDPLFITAFFVIFEWIFYLFFVLFLKQKFGQLQSLFVYLLVAISPYLVGHSRFFWNPHMLIPLSIISLVTINKFIDTHKYIFLFIASLSWGLAFSVHYSAIFWMPIFIYFLYKSNRLFDLKSWLIIILGILIGDLPLFVFELRHQFYNLKTFFYVYTNSPDSAGITSHYFIFPLLIFFIYFLLHQRSLFIAIATITTLYQFYIYPNYPSFGAVSGWDYPTQQKVVKQISQSCLSNFNIATTMQGDTRAYDLRFLLDIAGCPPQGVDSYPHVDKLILIAPLSHPPQSETVWEVSSLRPFTIDQEIPLNDKLTLYYLSRAN